MKKYFLFFINFLVLFGTICAQENCEVRGKVVDSLGKGIYNVSLIVFDATEKGHGFTYTNEKGNFRIQLECNQSYEFEFEHLNYKSLIKPVITNKNEKEEIKFVLANSNNALDEVVVEARIPIKLKGDILEFDAASFQTGQEENLEDVLKNLPGIQIEKGKVYYQGKEIKSITVEGREIFGGNTKLISKNLPSNAINKIQLNRKFKKNPFANSLQEEGDFALNIVLKEDKKSLVFGNSTAGTNLREHINLQGRAFYFNPKMDATLILDINTYGKEVFTKEDFMGFLGGISESQREGGKYSLRNNIKPLHLGTLKDAFKIRNNIGAIHLGYEPNDKWYANGFALFNANKSDYNTRIDRISDGINVLQGSQESQQLTSGLTQVRVDYFPSGNSEIKYRANINYQENKVRQFIENFSEFTPSTLTSQGEQHMNVNRGFFNFSHNLSYISKVGEDDNFGIYISHNFQKDKPNLTIEALNPIYNDIFDNQQEQNGIYNLSQKEFHKTNTLKLYSIYNYLITNTSNLKIKLGANFSKQEFQNDYFSYQLLLEERQQKTDASLSYKEYYGDLILTKAFGKFKLDLGVSLNKYEDSNNIIDQENSVLNQMGVLPSFNARYEWSTTKSISFNYAKSFAYPEIKELSNTYQIYDTYEVFIGNSDLEREVNHKLKLEYRFFKLISFFNLYLALTYDKKINSFQTTSTFNTSTQLNSIINSQKHANIYSGTFYLDKKLNRSYAIKFNGNLSLKEFYSFTNTNFNNSSMFNLVKNDIRSHNYKLTNNFKIKKILEINLGLGYGNNQYVTTNQSNTFNNKNRILSWKPFIDMAWVINDKLLFQSAYGYENQINNGKVLNEFNDLNFSLRYKPFKRTYITAMGGNLLDDQLVSNSFNDNYTQIVTRRRLGPYYLVNLKYKF